MKKAILLIIGLAGAGLLLWFFVINRGSDDSDVQSSQPQDFPAPFSESEPAASQAQYTSELSGLAFSYPSNWNVTEGIDNSAESELLTVESPMDINEFYFCLDINRVGSSVTDSFAISGANVIATETLQSGHQAVAYTVGTLDGIQWGITNESPAVGSDGFASEISNPSGERLQVLGRFNCREDNKPDLTKQEFQDARWLHEARDMINSLTF